MMAPARHNTPLLLHHVVAIEMVGMYTPPPILQYIEYSKFGYASQCQYSALWLCHRILHPTQRRKIHINHQRRPTCCRPSPNIIGGNIDRGDIRYRDNRTQVIICYLFVTRAAYSLLIHCRNALVVDCCKFLGVWWASASISISRRFSVATVCQQSSSAWYFLPLVHVLISSRFWLIISVYTVSQVRRKLNWTKSYDYTFLSRHNQNTYTPFHFYLPSNNYYFSFWQI